MGTGGAGPPELDLGPGIGQLSAQGEGIDGSGDTEIGIGSDVADPVVIGHGAGDGAGDELALIDPAVVGADGAIGLVHGAIEEPDLGILHRGLQGGPAQRRRGGEDHLSAVGHRLLDGGGAEVEIVGIVVALDHDLIAHDLLQVFAALLVTGDPGAGGRGHLMHEGHMEVVRQGDPGEQAGSRAFLGLGLHLDALLAHGDHVLPQPRQGPLQLRGRQAAQVLIGIQLQPQEQCLLGQDVLALDILLIEGIPEIVEIGIEGVLLDVGPGLVLPLAQMGKELCIVAGAAELDRIEPGDLEKVQEFVVGPDPGLLTGLGQDPLHIAGDPGGSKMAQDTDPLVALLDIEDAQIFKDLDRVPDARFAQMGVTEIDPLISEFGILVQQRQEIPGKGRDPALGLDAHDPLRRDLQQAHILGRVVGRVRQHLIQNSGIGRDARHDQFSVFFLSLFQGQFIFFHCDLRTHHILLKHSFTHTSY